MQLEIGKIITLVNSDKIIELDAAKKLYEYKGYKLEMLDWGYTFRVIGYADYVPDEPLPFDECVQLDLMHYGEPTIDYDIDSKRLSQEEIESIKKLYFRNSV